MALGGRGTRGGRVRRSSWRTTNTSAHGNPPYGAAPPRPGPLAGGSPAGIAGPDCLLDRPVRIGSSTGASHRADRSGIRRCLRPPGSRRSTGNGVRTRQVDPGVSGRPEAELERGYLRPSVDGPCRPRGHRARRSLLCRSGPLVDRPGPSAFLGLGESRSKADSILHPSNSSNEQPVACSLRSTSHNRPETKPPRAPGSLHARTWLFMSNSTVVVPAGSTSIPPLRAPFAGLRRR